MRIKDLAAAAISRLTSGTSFVIDNGSVVEKIDYNLLAKAIVENYNGSSLAGSAQSVKAALDSLNNSFLILPITPISGLTTEELINQAYDDAHSNTSNQTWYRKVINHGTQHSILGGGRWYLEGYRENANYGWQKATSYTVGVSDPIFSYERSIVNGSWGVWKRRPTYTEIPLGSTTYTPTITSESPNFTAENIMFWYLRVGGLLFINGRFQITNVGTSPATGKVVISLPSDFRCNDLTGVCGDVVAGKSGVDVSQLSIRQGTNQIWIQSGAGGVNALSILGTGYVLVNAMIMLM